MTTPITPYDITALRCLVRGLENSPLSPGVGRAVSNALVIIQAAVYCEKRARDAGEKD